jgi:uncharacterized membrane protein YfcA
MDFFSAVAAGGVQLAVAFLLLIVISFAAGLLGSLVGLGGGIVLVPALVLVFGVDVHLAIAASLVSVVATSLGTASTAVSRGLTDLRVGMFLETATAVGGLAGALVSVTLLARHGDVLTLVFIPAIVLGALLMLSRRSSDVREVVPPDRWADRLRLGGTFTDPRDGQRTSYRVTRSGTGLLFSGIAGVGAGLLGIGGGIFYVPAMNGVMNIPLRVASSTSIFMIGVTAAGGGFVYLYAGDVSALLAAPVVLGVLAGSVLGIRLQPSASTSLLKTVFVVALVAAAVLLGLRGIGVLG